MAAAVSSAWQPNPDGLNQMLALLRASQFATNTEEQRQVYSQLEAARNNPEFGLYLAFVFASAQNSNEPSAMQVRHQAGLQLKNAVPKLNSDGQAYVKAAALQSLGDASKPIRQTGGTIITTIVSHGGLNLWPNLIEQLCALIQDADENKADGAFDALVKVVDDNTEYTVHDSNLDSLIAMMVACLGHPRAGFRVYSLRVLNAVMAYFPPQFDKHLPNFLKGLFALASKTDATPPETQRVCTAIVTLLEFRMPVLWSNMDSIIEFILKTTNHEDEAVALEACEFWACFCDAHCDEMLSERRAQLERFLPRLVPLLLEKMQYGELELMMLDDDEDDHEDVPDRPEDIKPRFHHQSAAHGQDNDDDDDGGEVASWTLRKCAANGLDTLSTFYGARLMAILLPVLQSRLVDQSAWEVRESGILALGAIQSGCAQFIAPHLPQLLPYLTQLLGDKKPLVRSITCWTIGRYSAWICEEANRKTFFQPTLEALLQRVLDSSKQVQEAAVSAFATLEESAGYALVPFLSEIIKVIVFALQKYQAKNMLNLFDAIITLAEQVGDALAQPQLVSALFPHLMARWQSTANDDQALFPLFECLTTLMCNLGTAAGQFIEPIYQRCLLIVRDHLVKQQSNQVTTDPVQLLQEKEFVVCSLDLVAGIIEGIGGNSMGLVQQNNAELLPILLQTCQDDDNHSVRQSSFAVLGDLSHSVPQVVKPHVAKFVPVAIKNLTPLISGVCNNASWSLGELAVQCSDEMKPFIEPALQQLIKLLNNEFLQRQNLHLLHNACITIGRFGKAAPDIVGPHLAAFVRPWCMAMSGYPDDQEKESAFQGLCLMVGANPTGVLNDFGHLCNAMASCHQPSTLLQQLFHKVLHSFKTSLGDQWPRYFQQSPRTLQDLLTQRYQL